MKSIVESTAWPMTAPAPYSFFHIAFTAVGLTAAVFLAYYTAKRIKSFGIYRLLFCCGLLLTASECWKQLFLYYVVNGETYDWWYFPFQLCSLPMYFCLALPFVPSKYKTILCTFMQDFNLLGGIMALAEPSGLLHPYWFLTLHGLIWHLLLIYIGLVIAFARLSDTSIRGLVRIVPLFCACCLIAFVINVTAKPLGAADMFYISPYYPSAQIFFHEAAVKWGIAAGNIIYLLSACLGGAIFHGIFKWIIPPEK